PPKLSSNTAGAEMTENYSMVISRDVPFTDYASDPKITTQLDNNHMNALNILANILYVNPGAFTSQNLYRGNQVGVTIDPYISQLLYLNVPMGAATLTQKYK